MLGSMLEALLDALAFIFRKCECPPVHISYPVHLRIALRQMLASSPVRREMFFLRSTPLSPSLVIAPRTTFKMVE